MKKIIALLLVAAMSVLTMCACNITFTDLPESEGSESQSSDISQTSDSEATQSQSSDASQMSADDDASDSSELFNWTFMLNGVEYTLPCDYSVFADNNLTMDSEYENEQLESNTYTSVTLYKNGDDSYDNNEKFNIYLWNSSDSSKAYKDCVVGSIEITLKSEAELELAGGFVFDENTTIDDIISMYGEPTNRIEGDEYVVISYQEAVWSKYSFEINTGDLKKYSSVTIQCMD